MRVFLWRIPDDRAFQPIVVTYRSCIDKAINGSHVAWTEDASTGSRDDDKVSREMEENGEDVTGEDIFTADHNQEWEGNEQDSPLQKKHHQRALGND